MMLDDFGIDAIPVPLNEDGVHLEEISNILQNQEDDVGMLCVPRHSNPSGEIYSDEN